MSKPFYNAENFEARHSVGYLLRRLVNLTLPRAEALFADQELTLSHWIVLMALRDGIALTSADIARHLNYDSGAMTRLVDQLESRALVTRLRDKADQRIINLSLTPSGHAVTKMLLPRIVNFWNNMLDEFSHAETKMLLSLLTRLLNRAEREPFTTEAIDAGHSSKRISTKHQPLKKMSK